MPAGVTTLRVRSVRLENVRVYLRSGNVTEIMTAGTIAMKMVACYLPAHHWTFTAIMGSAFGALGCAMGTMTVRTILMSMTVLLESVRKTSSPVRMDIVSAACGTVMVTTIVGTTAMNNAI